jgi:hypothetical protein
MNIAIDLDQVMIDLTVVADVSKDLMLNFTDADVVTWGYNEFYPEFRRKIYEKFEDPKYMCNFKIYPWTINKLNLLKRNNFRLICATSRNQKVKNETIKAIKSAFPQIDLILFGENKVEQLIKNKVDILIDDNADTVKKALLADIKCYLVSNDNTKYNWWLSKCWDLPLHKYSDKLHIVESLNYVYI